jgi:AAA15 family ATPase/GTPase
MIEVEITNYQSIAHTKFVIDGFTTLVGRNSLGKSAVLRAVNAALTNQQGTDFIRWGERFCEVHIKTESVDIVWHKEENNNFYVINGGNPLTKIGREDPPKEVLDAGFKQIKISSQKINLNYADQFNPLFLVDKLDSKGADLLTSVYGLDRLYKAIDLCSKEQRDNRDELKLREKDLSLVNKDLDKFFGFDRVLEASSNLPRMRVAVASADNELQDLKSKLVKAQELVVSCKKLAAAKDVEVPSCTAIQDLVTSYKKVVQYNAQAVAYSSVINRLAPVFDIKVPTSDISGSIDSYRKIRALNDRYTELSKETSRLAAVETIVVPRVEIDTDSIGKLKTMYAEAMRQKKELIDLDSQLKELAKTLENSKTELDKYELCPLCGKSRK